MGIEWTAAWAAAAGVVVFFLAWLALYRAEVNTLSHLEEVLLLNECVRVAEKYIDDKHFHTYRMEIMQLRSDYKP